MSLAYFSKIIIANSLNHSNYCLNGARYLLVFDVCYKKLILYGFKTHSDTILYNLTKFNFGKTGWIKSAEQNTQAYGLEVTNNVAEGNCESLFSSTQVASVPQVDT